MIGTEITVFEPLARDFAEAYLARFLAGATVGEAVRGARLTLLARGNPLELAYIPFALESLRLTRPRRPERRERSEAAAPLVGRGGQPTRSTG